MKIFARNKRILLFFVVLTIALLALFAVFATLALTYHPSGKAKYADDDFISAVEKTSDDFVILNLTDIQLCDLEDIPHIGVITAEIDELVERVKPNLITVTGDLVWSNETNISLHALIRHLDGYGIPWAPVLGNHDLGNGYNTATASGDYLVSLFENAKNCLFRHGNRSLGIGNYAVKITDGGALYRVLYFIDNGYEDEISDAQTAWLDETATAIEAEYGKTDGMIFMHKPISEYADAYYAYLSGKAEAEGDVIVYCSLHGVDSNGLFEVLKRHGITDVVCGHQHANAFSLRYDGIRLTFGVKTGELSFYADNGEVNANGGTAFSLSNGTVTQVYVERDKYHIDGSENIAE